MNLKTFACDHRDLSKQGISWNFPFERLGTGFTNDCKLKDIDGESICTEDTNKFLSEYTAIWWLWKHYEQIGNPEFIGFIHYRRFFVYAMNGVQMQPLYSVVMHDKNASDNVIKLIPDDNVLYGALAQYKYDGILPCKFPDYGYCTGCKDVIDLMYAESCWHDLHLGFSYDMCKSMFDVLSRVMTQHFSQKAIDAAFAANNTFHFNMFILRKGLFFLYSDVMEKTVLECIELLKPFRAALCDRALSYAIERFSSCIFIAMHVDGLAKFGMLPLFVFENKEFLK